MGMDGRPRALQHPGCPLRQPPGSGRAVRPQIGAPLFWGGVRRARLRPLASRTPKGPSVPPKDRGLLARLDALVGLVADRHGLALLPDGRLAAAEARVAAHATGLAPRPRPTRGRSSQPAEPPGSRPSG